MASRLRSLLDAVCSTPAAFGEGAGASGVDIGVGGGGKAALRQTQRAVQSVVPALKAHGAEAGVGAYFVIQVPGVLSFAGQTAVTGSSARIERLIVFSYLCTVLRGVSWRKML